MEHRFAHRLAWALLLLFVVLLAWVLQNWQPPALVLPSPSPSSVILQNIPGIGTRTKTEGCQIQGPLPDKACTPGDILPNVTTEQICTPGYSASVRDVSTRTKNEVYADYGIDSRAPGEYEVDHLISLQLGGSNSIANLFPEAAEPQPGYKEKDRLENYLHDEVCEGKLGLSEAQRMIASDWVAVYNQFFQ